VLESAKSVATLNSKSDPVQGSKIAFTKASACGNDFLIVEGETVTGDLSAISRRMCDRHNGVGADGVLELSRTDEPGFVASLRIFNPDGSGLSGENMVAELRQRGVLLAMMDGRIRACTHLDVSAAMIEETVGLVRDIARSA